MDREREWRLIGVDLEGKQSRSGRHLWPSSVWKSLTRTSIYESHRLLSKHRVLER